MARSLKGVMYARLAKHATWLSRDELAAGASSSPVAIDDALADLVLEGACGVPGGGGVPVEGVSMLKKFYIAGPMTGLPEFNYPAFNEAARQLRAKGYEVLNPAENPVPPCGTWAGYMRMAVAQLVQCDGVLLLPGWTDSKGALIERQLAHVLEMEIFVAYEATSMQALHWLPNLIGEEA